MYEVKTPWEVITDKIIKLDAGIASVEERERSL